MNPKQSRCIPDFVVRDEMSEVDPAYFGWGGGLNKGEAILIDTKCRGGVDW